MRTNARQYAAIRRRKMIQDTEREAERLAKRAARIGAALGFDEESNQTNNTPADAQPTKEVAR